MVHPHDRQQGCVGQHSNQRDTPNQGVLHDDPVLEVVPPRLNPVVESGGDGNQHAEHPEDHADWHISPKSPGEDHPEEHAGQGSPLPSKQRPAFSCKETRNEVRGRGKTQSKQKKKKRGQLMSSAVNVMTEKAGSMTAVGRTHPGMITVTAPVGASPRAGSEMMTSAGSSATASSFAEGRMAFGMFEALSFIFQSHFLLPFLRVRVGEVGCERERRRAKK